MELKFAQKPATSLKHTMSRGNNYWEMTYSPEGEDPVAQKDFSELINTTGFVDAVVKIESIEGRRYNLKDKEFASCDFRGGLAKASFTRCKFLKCNFLGVHFDKIKFSDCTFERCNFLHVDLKESRFIDCHFSCISVSAEHFKCETTEIDVSAFIKAVTTNLEYLPSTVSRTFQLSQLVYSKRKIAAILYRSNQELFGPHFFSAHRHLTDLTIRTRIEDKRFVKSDQDKHMIERCWLSFQFRALIPRLELWSVRAAGFLTNWGQSVTRSVLFLLVCLFLFAFTYHYKFGSSWRDSWIRSLDVSLVAGYTAHTYLSASDTKSPPFYREVVILNLIAGIYWYSLIVPVITRKFLR